MHELELAGIRARRSELLPDEVFDRLDVVIRLPLELLDARESSRIDTPGEPVNPGRHGGREARKRSEAAGSRQLADPGRLHANTMADEGRLAEKRGEIGAFFGIASVERRQRVQAGIGHGAKARMIECVCYP